MKSLFYSSTLIGACLSMHLPNNKYMSQDTFESLQKENENFVVAYVKDRLAGPDGALYNSALGTANSFNDRFKFEKNGEFFDITTADWQKLLDGDSESAFSLGLHPIFKIKDEEYKQVGGEILARAKFMDKGKVVYDARWFALRPIYLTPEFRFRFINLQIKTAKQYFEEYKKLGYHLDFISINVDPQDFVIYGNEIVQMIKAERFGEDNNLVVELTERHYGDIADNAELNKSNLKAHKGDRWNSEEDEEVVARAVNNVRKQGVIVALDDVSDKKMSKTYPHTYEYALKNIDTFDYFKIDFLLCEVIVRNIFKKKTQELQELKQNLFNFLQNVAAKHPGKKIVVEYSTDFIKPSVKKGVDPGLEIEFLMPLKYPEAFLANLEIVFQGGRGESKTLFMPEVQTLGADENTFVVVE